MWWYTWKRYSWYPEVCNKMGTVLTWTRGSFDERRELPLLGTACGNPTPPCLKSVYSCRSLPFLPSKSHVPVEIPGNLFFTNLEHGMKGRNRNRHKGHKLPLLKHIQWFTHLPITSHLIYFLKQYLLTYLATLGLSCSMWDLIHCPGIEPGPPALGTQSLSHWTTRKFPQTL